MSSIADDRYHEITTTTGAGPFALSEVVPGCRELSEVLRVGDTFYGAIVQHAGSSYGWRHQAHGDYLTGLFTYSAIKEATVTEVYESSSVNAAVNFGAGIKAVFIISEWDAKPELRAEFQTPEAYAAFRLASGN